MDILISSNLERLLYEISSQEDELIKDLMNRLQAEGKYKITRGYEGKLSDLYGDFASENEVFNSIALYITIPVVILLDTHTAVASLCI